MRLRIEYDIDTSNFTTSCFNAMRDFLSKTNDYTLVTDIKDYIYGTTTFANQFEGTPRIYFRTNYSYFVAHSTLNDLYLIFMSFDGRIGLFVSTEWDSEVEIFYQKDVIYNGVSSNNSDKTFDTSPYSIAWINNIAYYIPMPTIGTCNKLVANYNTENETVMFSGLEPITYNFGTFSTSQNLTNNICFGNITKYGYWEVAGGFWYGGDAVCSLELYFRSWYMNGNPETGERNGTRFMVARLYWQYESNCKNGLDFHIKSYWDWEYDDGRKTWYDDPFTLVSNSKVSRLPDTVNHFNRFECFLRIDMDKFPLRPPVEKFDDEYNIDQKTDRRLPSFGNRRYFNPITEKLSDTEFFNVATFDQGVYTRFLPVVMRKQIWATTLSIGYYIPMVVSIDNTSKGLPSYWSLFPTDRTDSGHTVNDLNNISIISRLYFMVQRDPQVLNDYSCVGYNDVINYVNMKNMSTNRYINGTYPVKTGYYNCFQSGIRRSDLGFKGYAGLAFKMEEQDNEDNETNENETNVEE